MSVNAEFLPDQYQLFKESQIPFAIQVKPLGEVPEVPVPEVSFGNDPIVRCKDCRAYINPFVRWLDNGAKWVCHFCGEINRTEDYYYCDVGADGYRNDHDERPEYNCGTVDFIPVNEYSPKDGPMAPAYLFAFDVSKWAIESGYLQLACSTLLSAIENRLLPGMQNDITQIAFLTYDKDVHFYKLGPL